MPVTDKHIAAARALRARGILSWYLIGKKLRVNRVTLQRHCDPEYRDRRNRMSNDARARRTQRHESAISVESTSAEHRPAYDPGRDGILDHPLTAITARLMGDPVPGRSALDRKKSP